MDVWNQRIFLTLILILCVGHVLAASNQDNLDALLQADQDRRVITRDQLDSEDFEIGISTGIINMADFGSSNVLRLRLAYHVTEDFFMSADYGQAALQITSFERLSGATQLLSSDQRDVTFYNASIGYKLFPAEMFVGSTYAFYGNGYISVGAGNFHFADENHASYAIGAGLQLFATDWLSLQIDLRDHLFEHDLLGETLSTHNLEATIGVSAFF
jgi:outer membrane beta-barrel protein